MWRYVPLSNRDYGSNIDIPVLYFDSIYANGSIERVIGPLPIDFKYGDPLPSGLTLSISVTGAAPELSAIANALVGGTDDDN